MDKRIFNRYKTRKLGIKVVFPNLEADYYLEDASLNGIQINGTGKITTKEFNKVIIKLSDNEQFTVNIFQVWHNGDQFLEGKNSKNFQAGFKLKFIEKIHFEKWLKFITALHEVQLKNHFKNNSQS